MAKIGIVSDSHGAAGRIEAVARVFSGIKDLTHVIHLGDVTPDAERLSALLKRDVIAVRGNCDFMSRKEAEEILCLDGLTLYCCHGDRYRVKQTLGFLSLRAQEVGAQAALYGHTHLPAVEWVGGVLLVNPGALRDGRYALMETGPHGPVPRLFTL